VQKILVLHEKPVKAPLSSLHFTSATKPTKSYNNCYYSSSEPVTDEEDEL